MDVSVAERAYKTTDLQMLKNLRVGDGRCFKYTAELLRPLLSISNSLIGSIGPPGCVVLFVVHVHKENEHVVFLGKIRFEWRYIQMADGGVYEKGS